MKTTVSSCQMQMIFIYVSMRLHCVTVIQNVYLLLGIMC